MVIHQYLSWVWRSSTRNKQTHQNWVRIPALPDPRSIYCVWQNQPRCLCLNGAMSVWLFIHFTSWREVNFTNLPELGLNTSPIWFQFHLLSLTESAQMSVLKWSHVYWTFHTLYKLKRGQFHRSTRAGSEYQPYLIPVPSTVLDSISPDTLGESVNPCLLLVCFDDAMHGRYA